MPWISQADLDKLDANIDSLGRRLEAAQLEVSRMSVTAAKWEARYEELAKWLENGGLKIGGPPSPAPTNLADLAGTDPFAESPEERARIEKLFLEDPEAAMSEAFGDSDRSTG